jgi:outer membrane lipoprotein LolB
MHCAKPASSARRSIPIVLAVLLAACKTLPPQSAVRDAAQLHQWQAIGRIAIGGVESGGSGSFTWEQRDAQSKILLRGPAGIGSVRLSVANRELTVETSDGAVYSDAVAQDQLQSRLGSRLPTEELRYWLLGLAAPGEHRWNNGSESSTLQQRDWRIDYQRFAVIAGVRLPMRLVAQHGATKVRIVIDKWQLP